MEEEIWKSVEGFEGYYEVSNMGRVKSLARIISRKHGGPIVLDDKFINGELTIWGYRAVTLYKPEFRARRPIHRLVAKAFVPNPLGYKQVNHKNEIKTDNRASNLEWCDARYNINYGTAPIRRAIKRGVPVVQMEMNGNVIARYYGLMEASRITGVARENIGKCCRGERHMAGGFKWKYAHE